MQEAFDKVFTIHCIYFWPDVPEGVKGIRTVLRPGGKLAITILPRDRWTPDQIPPADLFTLYTSEEVKELLENAGFRDVRSIVHPPDVERFPRECIIGIS